VFGAQRRVAVGSDIAKRLQRRTAVILNSRVNAAGPIPFHHFREVHLGRKYEYFTDVKWDGEYLALLGQEYAYRISLMGKQGRVVQSVRLFGQVWFWIVPTYSQVVSTDGEGSVQITGYPGGTYVKVINVGMPSFPPAVSLAASAP
jgi:hypothetical protein